MQWKDHMTKRIKVTVQRGTGKSETIGNRAQRRATAKKMASVMTRDVDVMIGPNADVGKVQIKALVDDLWNAGQKDLAETGTTLSRRGRLANSATPTHADSVIYWAYSHCRPKPLFILTTDQAMQQGFWDAATDTPNGEFLKMGTSKRMTDIVQESLEAQAAESGKDHS